MAQRGQLARDYPAETSFVLPIKPRRLFMNVRSILSAAVVAVGLATFAHADITGKITYEGKAPAMKKINMQAVPACAAQHPAGVTEETLVVGKNKELANAVVSLKNPPAGGKAPSEAAVLDQKGCQY